MCLLASLSNAQRAAPEDGSSAAQQAGDASLAQGVWPDPTTAAVAAANQVLEVLGGAKREAMLFDFDDDEQRANWSNLPIGMVPRGGVRIGDLTPVEQEAVMVVVAATLSAEGYRHVVDAMVGDQVLRTRGGRRDFGVDEYYFAILGAPSVDEPWMWQLGGHHLAINATVVGERIALTPSLTGGQPMAYEFKGRRVRLMQREIERSFELVSALDAAQRDVATLGSGRRDLALGPGRDGRRLDPEGLRGDAMTDVQRDILLALIGQRASLLPARDAAVRMAELESDLDDTYFAWSGPMRAGEAYFRVQGPRLVMEFSPQRSREPGQHVHAIYRDPTNDYGARLILESRRLD